MRGWKRYLGLEGSWVLCMGLCWWLGEQRVLETLKGNLPAGLMALGWAARGATCPRVTVNGGAARNRRALPCAHGICASTCDFPARAVPPGIVAVAISCHCPIEVSCLSHPSQVPRMRPPNPAIHGAEQG